MLKEHTEFIEQLTIENFRLKSEPNVSYRDGFRDTNLNSSPNFKDYKSCSNHKNRYHLRNMSPYSFEKDVNFLSPKIEEAKVTETPSPK